VLSGHSDLPAGSPSRAAVQRAAATFAARLQLEITRSALNHRRVSGGAAPVAVYLTGGGSLIPELPAVLAEKLKLRIERYEALRHVDLSGDARAAGADAVAPVLADLVGWRRDSSGETSRGEPAAAAITEAIAFRQAPAVVRGRCGARRHRVAAADSLFSRHNAEMNAPGSPRSTRS